MFALATVLLVAMPAGAMSVVQQTRGATLRDLDLAPVEKALSFDPFVAPPGEHLVGVVAFLDAFINGNVTATNYATGGNAASRRRDASATYTLAVAAFGNGLYVADTQSVTQTKTGVAGQGNSFRLGQIDPDIFAAGARLGGFAPFLAGPVVFTLQASQAFDAVATQDVVYDAPEITRGHAYLTLFYFSAVPEPATWLLLGSGFAFVGIAVRRRSRFPAVLTA